MEQVSWQGQVRREALTVGDAQQAFFYFSNDALSQGGSTKLAFLPQLASFCRVNTMIYEIYTMLPFFLAY